MTSSGSEPGPTDTARDTIAIVSRSISRGPTEIGIQEKKMVEAVGIEPTSEKRVPKVSTHIAFTYGHRPCAMQKAAYASASSDLTIPLRSGTNLSVQSTLASPQPVPWTMAHGWNVTVN